MKSDIDVNAIEKRIDVRMQQYLGIPPAERGVRDPVTGWTEYDRLIDDLAHIALDYADTLIKTRMQAMRDAARRKGW